MPSLSSESIQFVSYLQKPPEELLFHMQIRFSRPSLKGVKQLHPIETPGSKMSGKKTKLDSGKPVTLKILAEYFDLSPATVSIVLNNSPVAKSISAETRQRVLAAAQKFE